MTSAKTWQCLDCGRVVAFYDGEGWEHEPERHAPSCEYWDYEEWLEEREEDEKPIPEGTGKG